MLVPKSLGVCALKISLHLLRHPVNACNTGAVSPGTGNSKPISSLATPPDRSELLNATKEIEGLLEKIADNMVPTFFVTQIFVGITKFLPTPRIPWLARSPLKQ